MNFTQKPSLRRVSIQHGRVIPIISTPTSGHSSSDINRNRLVTDSDYRPCRPILETWLATQWRIQVFLGCPETPPPGRDFFLKQGFDTILEPTFTSHLNLRVLDPPPPDTNSGYATLTHAYLCGRHVLLDENVQGTSSFRCWRRLSRQ